MDTIRRKIVYFYIHDTLIPQMLEEMDPEFRDQLEDKQDTAKVELLERYGPTNLCSNTVGIWLNNLGFSYGIVSNKYYVHGHEKEDTIWYIHKFTDRYLLLERWMHRWIQMTTEE